MFVIFIALGVMLVAGLVVVSEQSALANKGGIPNEHASSKAHGRGGNDHGGGVDGGNCDSCGGNTGGGPG